MTLTVAAIVAMDEARVIGVKNQLPWRIPEDSKRFMTLTTGHTVMMGRKTWESLPPKYKPLPNRKNVVFSRGDLSALALPDGVEGRHDPLGYIRSARSGEISLPTERLWVVGGSELYALTMPEWDELYLTVVHSKHEGDAFFPPFEDEFVLEEEEPRPGFSFLRYARRR